jgi:hypothetical protein
MPFLPPISDRDMLALLRNSIAESERLCEQTLALIAETTRLLELIDKIASPHIDQNKSGG